VPTNACDVVADDGRLVGHTRGIDVRGWDPQIVFADRERTRELVRFDRPSENRRLEVVRDEIPRTDLVYRVWDSPSLELVGALQRSWAARSLRDRWILRGPDWSERGRVQETSLIRSLVRVFVTSLPRRYAVSGPAGELGSARRSWDLARVSVTMDVSADAAGSLDRRLLLVLAILLVFG